MNNRTVIGIMLVLMAAVMIGFITSSAGESASRFFGCAIWYLPYATVLGAVRLFRLK